MNLLFKYSMITNTKQTKKIYLDVKILIINDNPRKAINITYIELLIVGDFEVLIT